MSISQIIKKLTSSYLWGNLTAMALVVVAVCLGVRYGIDLYTHHGERIAIPNVKHKNIDDARYILEDAGLTVEVTDTGYVKTLRPGAVLEQMPAAGGYVKSGHVIRLTINAESVPSLTIPDVIDNSSLREAMAKLTAMGFRLGTPQYVEGEHDWVYGIMVGGRHVAAGDKVSIESVLIIQVGNGQRSAADSVDYIDPVFEEVDPEEEAAGDNFEEVTIDEPATTDTPPAAAPNTPPTTHSNTEVVE